MTMGCQAIENHCPNKIGDIQRLSMESERQNAKRFMPKGEEETGWGFHRHGDAAWDPCPVGSDTLGTLVITAATDLGIIKSCCSNAVRTFDDQSIFGFKNEERNRFGMLMRL